MLSDSCASNYTEYDLLRIMENDPEAGAETGSERAHPLLPAIGNAGKMGIERLAKLLHDRWQGIGHQLAYVLLGVALLRARVIPRWAAWLIMVSAPVMGPIAYGTKVGLLQILGYVLIFIGSVPAALAMLKRRDEQAQALVPTAEELTPTT